MYQDDLAKLTKDELIALGLAQAARIAELTRRVAELEAKLGQPPKTPDNSSVPPSQGRKPNRAERRAAKKRKGRSGVFRALADNPDRIVESHAERCPHCAHELSPDDTPTTTSSCRRFGRSSPAFTGIAAPARIAVAGSVPRHPLACRRARLSAPI
jgi:hypothetical protein